MAAYHEPVEELDPQTRDYVRALNTLKEEVEAIDWYQQRIAACNDEELKKILVHNRDEEIEHAVMSLEWLRRNMPGWEEQLRTYMFTEKSILDVEEEAEEGGGEEGSASGQGKQADLGIRGMKG